MVVTQHDVLDAQFRTDRPQSNPLAFEVRVVGRQFRDGAGFGVGNNGELIAGRIVAGDVESDKITGLRSDGPAGRDVNHARPDHVLTVLLHAEQG